MSTRFSLQKPYVVAALPSPIDPVNGRYVVGEVYSAVPGSKKRKRSEVAVGIDGEGVNLYDVSSSRLVTTYALPPQSFFTCSPTSLRNRISRSIIERHTYVSTTGPKPQITLFSELSKGSAPPQTSTTTCVVEGSQQSIVYAGIVTARGSDVAENTSGLLTVKKDGEIQYYDGKTLTAKWTSPPSALVRDSSTLAGEIDVEFAHLTSAYAASQGILKGRQDVFELFPQEIIEDGFNPEILVLVTKSKRFAKIRTLHIVSLPRRSEVPQNGLKRSVDLLLAAEIPSITTPETPSGESSFSIQVSAGILQLLERDILTTFDLSDTLPKVQSTIRSVGAESFLRLSSTSIMVSSDRSINVYNTKYQSTLATVDLEMGSNGNSLKRKRNASEAFTGSSIPSCKFVNYFQKIGLAVAISNNNLVAIQVEGQHDSHGKPAVGSISDSLSRSTMGHCRPGCMEEVLWQKRKAEAEGLAAEETIKEFDTLMISYLDISKSIGNGTRLSKAHKTKFSKKHVQVDSRWVLFILSKIFTVSENEDGELALAISLFPPRTFTWLTLNRYLTVSDIETALREYGSPGIELPAGQLVNALVEADPEMNLLLGVLSQSSFGATELLHAIRVLMASLGQLGENPATKQMFLTNGEDMESAEDLEEQVKKLEAEAKQDLDQAQYQLGPGARIRADALSLALSKLSKCESAAIVRGLQTTFTSQEVVCLIYLLRFELAQGSWTTRYLDADDPDIVNQDAEVQDDAITLISDLLNNCVDAVGAGGWLTGEARLVDGDPYEAEELITSLKLEVSAALEGIEEAVYFKGLTSEMIRYGDGVENGLSKESQTENKGQPIVLPSLSLDFHTLPLGLKAEKRISLLKVAAGGAVYQRSKRDIGNLKSQKVGKYTRERIVL